MKHRTMGQEIYQDKRIIVAFDFDGTITKRDTLPAFIRFASNLWQILVGSLRMIPSLILFKLKIIPNFQAKEKLFKIFFRGVEVNRFNSIAKNFSKEIDGMVNPEALERIKCHQRAGHYILIISASPENWITPWANQNGIYEVLATRLEVKDGQITGKFSNKNCHGQEKVNRLLEIYPNRERYTLYAYGDSNGDKELLALADYSFYRCYK
jgi:phosphatidylglycerophosphatase C